MDLRLIILGICEFAGLFFIWRLWRRQQRRSLAFRLCWSVLLLIPVIGIVFYGLVLNDPLEKPGWGSENNQGWGMTKRTIAHEPCAEHKRLHLTAAYVLRSAVPENLNIMFALNLPPRRR